MRLSKSLKLFASSHTLFLFIFVFLILFIWVDCEITGQDVDLRNLVKPKGFKISGSASSEQTGMVVNAAGDINGDHISDVLIVGAGSTTLYVVFGNITGANDINFLGMVAGPTVGYRITVTGIAVKVASGAGDVNGDGIGDIVVGCSAGNVAYVIFGHDSKATGVVVADLVLPFTTNAYNGFKMYGGTFFGEKVGAAGDVNSDGVDDFMVATHYGVPPTINGIARSQAGIVYVIFGRNVAGGASPFGDFNVATAITGLNGATSGFRILGRAATDQLGLALSSAGDFNGDGVDDLVIGAYRSDIHSKADCGLAYIIYGRHTRFGMSSYSDIDLYYNLTDTNQGFRVEGALTNDVIGFAVSNAGDMNNDGISDVLVAGYNARVVVNGLARTNVGVTYVLFGRNVTISKVPFSDILLSSFVTSPSTGFRIAGAQNSDFSGRSVSAAGDVNGDGISDIIIGAPSADPPAVGVNSNAGISYVIFGRDVYGGASAFVDIDLRNIVTGSTAGFRIMGVGNQDNSGWCVSGGDINGDGISDVIVGAYAADPVSMGTNSNAGITYVVYGAPTDPTSQPSSQPSMQPSSQPTTQPSCQPVSRPSSQPSEQPVSRPTGQPSCQPTTHPSSQPTGLPSQQPSSQPTSQPSAQPVAFPSAIPSVQPIGSPSTQPTDQPTSVPSTQPSCQPSASPSTQPTITPTTQPSVQPSNQPTSVPSGQPSVQPSAQPNAAPTTQPSSVPTTQPSSQPSAQPSDQPSQQPSVQPSCQPSNQPSGQPTVTPSAQPSREPSSQPSICPTSQPSAHPSAQPSTQPSSQPSSKPSRQPSGQPTGVPSAAPSQKSTGEWATFLGSSSLRLSALSSIDSRVWACGIDTVDSLTTATTSCSLVDALSGELTMQYGFPWSAMLPVLGSSEGAGAVTVSGRTASMYSSVSDIASCAIWQLQLFCNVKSFADASFLVSSYVPYPNKTVYVGVYNVYVSATIVDVYTDTMRSYIYTLFNMKSVVLSQIQSPPNFMGTFVVGTAVRSAGAPVHYIVAGMLRTANGVLSAMALLPTNSDIVNNDDLVTAMALEHTGPDSFIVGGMALSDGAGVHAYLLRANSMYNTVQYCVRYRSTADDGSVHSEHRRVLTDSVGASHSVVRGVMLVNTELYMIVDHTRANVTSLTVLRTSAHDGAVLHQVHVSAPNASLTCSDITSTGMFLTLSCSVVYNAIAQQSLLISVNRELSFAVLPVGFVRGTTHKFREEVVPFQRTVVSVTTASTTIATTEYDFNTADHAPTRRPSPAPTSQPSVQPSSGPSAQPSSSPIATPTVSARPTSQPSSAVPTNTHKPSAAPSIAPTKMPTPAPTARSSLKPTVAPSARPTTLPSASPSAAPSVLPSTRPTAAPSATPTRSPRLSPSAAPQRSPTAQPTATQADVSGESRNTDQSTVVGASVGGALALFLCGFVWYKYKQYIVEEDARSQRKSEFFAKQAKLVEALEQERAEMVRQIRLEDARREKNRKKKDKIVGGAYATGPVQRPPTPPSPLPVVHVPVEVSPVHSSVSNWSVSSMSSQMDWGEYRQHSEHSDCSSEEDAMEED